MSKTEKILYDILRRSGSMWLLNRNLVMVCFVAFRVCPGLSYAQVPVENFLEAGKETDTRPVHPKTTPPRAKRPKLNPEPVFSGPVLPHLSSPVKGEESETQAEEQPRSKRPPLNPEVGPLSKEATSIMPIDSGTPAPDSASEGLISTTAATEPSKADQDSFLFNPWIDSEFIKGELSASIGSTKLVTKNSRVGVRLGYLLLDEIHYGSITPEIDLRFRQFQIGVGAPLAFEILNAHLDPITYEIIGFQNAGRFRREDWDEPSEYVRFVRYLNFGKKEDRLYFNLSQHASQTIGHGALMRRYGVNLHPDSTSVSGEFDVYNDYAGLEFVVNDIVDWELFGGIVFVKPLSLFADRPELRSLSLGITYLVDRKAPLRLATETSEPYLTKGLGMPEIAQAAPLHSLGVDLEVKVLKTKHVDLKPFVDYSWLLPAKHSDPELPSVLRGSGLTLGLLGRFTFGVENTQAIRSILEFRSFSENYLPGYFDNFYEIHKYIFGQDYLRWASEQKSLPPTKFKELFINRRDDRRHLGFYVEFNYAVVGQMALTLSLEGSTAEAGNHFLAHLEYFGLNWAQFFVTFHQRSMLNLAQLFSSTETDKILFFSSRIKLLPFLFVNFRYHHAFELRQHLFGEVDLDGDGFLDQYRYFKTVQGWMGDVELGFEF